MSALPSLDMDEAAMKPEDEEKEPRIMEQSTSRKRHSTSSRKSQLTPQHSTAAASGGSAHPALAPIQPAYTAVDPHASSSSLHVSKPSSASSLSSTDDELIPVRIKRYKWQPPADVSSHPYEPHQGEGSQYLRDFILGVNDGIVSTFLVVVAMVGGNSTTLAALLAGISSAIAGALSMGIGEFIATKSQLAVADGEYRLETQHFKYHRDVELEQLRSYLSALGLEGNLLEAVVSEVGRDDEALMRMMQAFEFGGQEELERSPWKAMFMSGRLFFVGSLPTIIPFFFDITPGVALGIAAAAVGSALFLVGAYKTRTTRGNPWFDGMENLTLGAIGAGISYGIGAIFDAVRTAA